MKQWWVGFPGKNVILCGGRVMLGPDWKTYLVSVGLTVIPTGVFFAFSGPFLWAISPILPIIVGVLLVIAMGSLTVAASIDPGIIPRVPKVC